MRFILSGYGIAFRPNFALISKRSVAISREVSVANGISTIRLSHQIASHVHEAGDSMDLVIARSCLNAFEMRKGGRRQRIAK